MVAGTGQPIHQLRSKIHDHRKWLVPGRPSYVGVAAACAVNDHLGALVGAAHRKRPQCHLSVVFQRRGGFIYHSPGFWLQRLSKTYLFCCFDRSRSLDSILHDDFAFGQLWCNKSESDDGDTDGRSQLQSQRFVEHDHGGFARLLISTSIKFATYVVSVACTSSRQACLRNELTNKWINEH